MSKMKKIIPCIGIFAIIVGLTGCTYYLEDVHTITNIPNNSPVPVFDRKENDVRINIQTHGSPNVDEKAFNDGNFKSEIHSQGNYYSAPYSSLNIKLRHTRATGLLALDYSPFNHFFIYGKIGSGILDGKYYPAGNLGLGIYNKVGSISIQYYIFTGGNQLYSDVVYIEHWDESDDIYTTAKKSFGLEPGLGVQIITNTQYGYWPHFYGGIEIQLLRYCSTNSSLWIIIPTIGTIENIGKNNQLLFSIECPASQYFIWPTISLGWTFQLNFGNFFRQ
ncbi:MAG: hypothetical protein ABSF80_06915 [Chitinispirillaceae bacterium]|jgi:hypothetical protein